MMSIRLKVATFALFGALAASGCRCGETVTQRQYGEIGVVYEAEGSTRTDRDATYQFGSVFMGQTVTQKIIVKNLGAGALTLASLEYVEGDSVKIGENGEGPWQIQFESGRQLGAADFVELDATFIPPSSSETQVDHRVVLTLRAENAREGEETAKITLIGKAVSGVCELPSKIEFGKVALDDTFQAGFEVRNPTQLAAEATVTDPTSSSGDHNAFTFAPDSARGTFTLDPDTVRSVLLDFRPTEKKSYLAFMKARASAQCPEVNIQLSGEGVDTVLSWTPAQIDCGYATPGIEVSQAVTFANAGKADVNLSQIKTLNTNEFRAVPENSTEPTKLTVPGQGGTAVVQVFCKPAVLGPRQTSLTFQTSLAKQPQGSIPVKAFGGGPEIDVKPAPNLNFGKVAYFSGANPPSFQKKKLTVLNVGTKPAVPDPKANLRLGKPDAAGNYGLPFVEITPANAETAADEFQVTVPATYDPNIGLEASVGKNALDLVVTVTPQSVGLKQATIKIFSNDPDEATVTINVSADAVVLPPCNYTVSPTALNFGLISPPDYRDLGFIIKNNGTNATDVCLLSGLDIAPGSNAFFTLPNGPVDQKELQPGEQMQVLVRVWPQGQTPSGVSSISGNVDFFMSSPLKPQATVSLSAQLAPSCLTIAPDELDFGTVQVGCSSATKTFNIYNTCSSPVTINSFSMQAAGGQAAGGPNCPGTAPCPEYVLVQSPAIPSGGLVLNAGDAPRSFQVKYKPIDIGSDTGAVAITATQNAANVTYVVALQAKGDTEGIQTDVFTQDAKPKADILLTIDNSCSMSDEQQSLATNFASFIKFAQSAQVDYHIAVTTTDNDSGGEQGRFVFGPTHPEKILSPSTVDVENKFKAKVNLGINGSASEMGAAPSLAALTPPLINSDNAGFLRNDAALAVVVITDEVEQSPNSTTFYLNAFWNIKGFNRKTMFTFNAISGFSPSCPSDDGSYATMVQQTNGVKEDICTPDWSKTLENLGKTAFGFRTNFFLTSVPDLTKGAIEVRIDGQLIPSVDDRGATVWTYDSVGSSVNFEPMYVPEPGQTLTITYHVTCYP